MPSASGPRSVNVDTSEHLTAMLWRRADDDSVAVRHHLDGDWVGVSWRELAERVRGVAAGLIATGIAPGDSVMVMSSTRLEWTIADLAILTAGAVTVPVYETDAASQCAWVASNAGVRLAVAETTEYAERIEEARDETPDLGEVLVLEDGGLEQLADRPSDEDVAEIDARLQDITGDTVASIVYTSGTTGRPKGCVLTHRNLVWTTTQATHALESIFEDEDASTLMYLPLAHIFTRIVQYGCLQRGVGLGYARSMDDLPEDLATFRPTFLLGVPRVFEKVRDNARRQAGGGLQRRVFDLADDTADEVAEDDPGLVTRAKAKVADTLVYDKVRDALGGRLHTIVSGGAPLSDHLTHFFEAAGIEVLQGYGLTETSAVISASRPGASRTGTVGEPLPGVEVRLDDDGGVFTRGEHVFAGYHRNQKATDEVLDADGWYDTEDLGVLDDGTLAIHGRRKDLIVTAGGKNVAPEPLQEIMKEHPLVSQSVLFGDEQKFVAALITLDEQELVSFARQRGLTSDDAGDLAGDEQVRAEVQRAVDRANEQVSRAESVREFRILPRELTLEEGELTATMKPKRAVIEEHFADELEAIYAS